VACTSDAQCTPPAVCGPDDACVLAAAGDGGAGDAADAAGEDAHAGDAAVEDAADDGGDDARAPPAPQKDAGAARAPVLEPGGCTLGARHREGSSGACLVALCAACVARKRRRA
jgi:hypothetical protein